jgi:hypothetical protein
MKYRVVVEYIDSESIMYGTQVLIVIVDNIEDANKAKEVLEYRYQLLNEVEVIIEESNGIEPEFKNFSDFQDYFGSLS